MSLFESAWLLMKAPLIDIDGKTYIDPKDFTPQELYYSPYTFPMGQNNVERWLDSPEGIEEMKRLRKFKINYPLNQNLLAEEHAKRSTPQIDFSNPMQGKRLPVYLAETKPMPSRSTSYPTQVCATGRHLRSDPDSTCYGCYAEGFTYNSDNTARRQLQSYHDMLQDPMDYHLQLASQVPTESREGLPVFRHLDSGDLHSPEHLAMLLDMATLTPDIVHWIPTREFGMVNKLLASRGYSEDAIPPNVRLRMSMPYRNQTVDDDWNVAMMGEKGRLTPVQRRVLEHPNMLRTEVWDEWLKETGMLPDSAITDNIHWCPKDDPDFDAKSCVDANCLACFNDDVLNVGYVNKPTVMNQRLKQEGLK